MHFKSVKHVKDLGIMISSDLSWSKQVNVTVNKATNYWLWFTEQWARQIPVRSPRYTNLLCARF